MELPERQRQQYRVFNFLADKIAEMNTPNTMVMTKEDTAISNQLISLGEGTPCSHDEADTSIFVRARHASTAAEIKVLMIRVIIRHICCSHSSQCPVIPVGP